VREKTPHIYSLFDLPAVARSRLACSINAEMESSGSNGGDRSSWRGRGREEFRGRNRGRGTGARGSQSKWTSSVRGAKTDPKTERLEKRPTGHLIGTINLSDIRSHIQFKDPAPTIEDCVYIASYNWLNRKNPTIIVPGEFADILAELHSLTA